MALKSPGWRITHLTLRSLKMCRISFLQQFYVPRRCFTSTPRGVLCSTYKFLFMHFSPNTCHIHNLGSSVGIDTRLRNRETINLGWILCKGKRFASRAVCPTGAGTHIACYLKGIDVYSPGIKAVEARSWQLSIFTAGIKNKWSRTSTPS